MTASLPVVHFNGPVLELVDPDTGEIVPAPDASDRALVAAAEQVAALDSQLYAAKRALAAELHDRHGVGATSAGGYRFTIAESQSWPVGATGAALELLVRRGAISRADVERAMPEKPKPDARALKALAGRLIVKDPDAARILADACTVSPPSLRDITPTAVDHQELPQ